MSLLYKAAASLAIVACSLHALPAHAEYVLIEGSAQVNFSTNALQAFQSAGITVSATSPATYTAPTITFTANDMGIQYSGDVVSALTAEGGLNLTSSTVAGARVNLTNITVDSATGNVFADGQTSSWSNATLGNYTGTNFTQLRLFTSTLTGQSNILLGGDAIHLSLSDLRFSSEAIPVLGNALGIPAFLQSLIFPSLNVGSVAVNASFAPAVPEPDSFILMLLGAGVMSGFARRRSHQA